MISRQLRGKAAFTDKYDTGSRVGR